MTVDAHVHLGRQFRGWRSRDFLSDMAAAARQLGVDVMLASALGTDEFLARPTIDELWAANALVGEATAVDPIFAGVVYCSGEHPQASIDLMRRYIAEGTFVGVKLWIARVATDPGCDAIFEYAAELGVPVLQHAWWKSTGQLPGESTPADVAAAARRHPDTTIQMAHLVGSGIRGIHDIADCPNVVLDTSGSDAEDGLVGVAVDILGADRVIFGSDAPGRDLAVQMARVEATPLAPGDRAAVLGGNALRIYSRLDLPPPRPVADAPTGQTWTDVSAFVGAWPERELPASGRQALEIRLRSSGVQRGFASALGAVWAPRTRRANRDLAEQLNQGKLLEVVPVLNPADPSWEAELDEWAAARAIRLVPGSHHYDVAIARDLLDACAERNLTVILQLRMADPRSTSAPERPVPVDTVRDLVEHCRARVVVAAATTVEIIDLLATGTDSLWCELSHADGQAPLEQLVTAEGAGGLLCGSHAPILMPEAMRARLTSTHLDAKDLDAIRHGNARSAGLT